jgi:hypothetical protein
LVSYALRAYSWRRYKVYLDIQALQISLLGGRIFFKGVRYSGDNETLMVQSGHITWRYWLRKVRDVDVGEVDPGTPAISRNGSLRNSKDYAGHEKSNLKGASDLPCRVLISVHGLEWFVYNRSPAYDAIETSLRQTAKSSMDDKSDGVGPGNGSVNVAPRHPREKHTADQKSRDENSRSSTTYDQTSINNNDKVLPEISANGNMAHLSSVDEQLSPAETASIDSDASDEEDVDGTDSIMLKLLPIRVECSRGAIVLGNKNTKCILITTFEKASGEFDASHARNNLDHYKQLVNMAIERPVVRMKPNPTYQESLMARAIHEKEQLEKISAGVIPKRDSWLERYPLKLWRRVYGLSPFSDRPYYKPRGGWRAENRGGHVMAPGNFGDPDRWIGLSRYMDDDLPEESDRWASTEYAKVSTLVDAPSAAVSFYWDVPGKVPAEAADTRHRPLINDINGDTPPDWGINITFDGGTVYYGPWADRQRLDIQNMFFPAVYKDAVPAKKLNPGESRISTAFKIYIEVRGQTTLRVPIREESKDWKWKGRARPTGATETKIHGKDKKKSAKGKKSGKEALGPEVRPFGWLDVKVQEHTTISYVMDTAAGVNGYSSKIDLDVRQMEILSSVNHAQLWKSDREIISCDLSTPAKWNGPRKWKFDVASEGMKLFVLREHVFLLTDLITDWGAGPPGDYYTFTPYEYALSVRLSDFGLYLNANDSNIINNPADMSDNTFLVIKAPHLTADLTIPLNKYRPTTNEIPFKVDANQLCLSLHTPPWNTHATFLDSCDMGNIAHLSLEGRYNYFTSSSPTQTDTLVIDMDASVGSFTIYGFLIRHVMTIIKNYFGDDIHFKTLEEFQTAIAREQPVQEVETTHHNPKRGNDLDVILAITCSDFNAILPSHIYSAKDGVQVDMASISADLRFTNYYMDLEANFSPMALSVVSHVVGDGDSTPSADTSQTQVFANGLTILGHRLFGLPPPEPTYMCNWDFSIGSVTGECSSDFFKSFVFALKSLAFTFDDDENALPKLNETVLYDVTFLRAKILDVRIWLHVDQAAFLIETGTISVNFDDWADVSFSERLSLVVPQLTFACVDGESASRHRTRDHPSVKTHAYFQTTVCISMVQRKIGFTKVRHAQQRHIRVHDQRTHRAQFLLHSEDNGGPPSSRHGPVDPPAMTFPSIPEPLKGDLKQNFPFRSGSFGRAPMRTPSRKSSFLSAVSSNSSSTGSIRRPKSNKSNPSVSTQSGRAGRSSFHALTAMTPTPVVKRSTSQFGNNSVSSWSNTHNSSPQRNGLPESNVTFSSPYAAPYFPLHAVVLDLEDIPGFPIDIEGLEDEVESNAPIMGPLGTDFDENAVRTSFMIDLKPGIKAFCTPEALHAVAKLLETLQPTHATEVLDGLQVDAMSKISALARRKLRTGKTVDVRIKIPYISFSFVNELDMDSQTFMEDQYRLKVTKLLVTARMELTAQQQGSAEGGKESESLHIAVGSVSLSVRERSGSSLDDSAAARAQLDDISLWVRKDSMLSAHFQSRDIQAGLESSSVEYLALLIHRTALIGEDLKNTFSAVGKAQRQRLQRFAFFLAKEGDKAGPLPDPSFLTRPSYVLRSAPDHLRMSDSWKIISRIRHVYRTLPQEIQEFIELRSADDFAECPLNAQATVIASLDQWRNWELRNIDASFAIQEIYGITNENSKAKMFSLPIKADVKTGILKLAIDPGPKQNEVAIEALTLGLMSNVPLMIHGLPLRISSSARTTSLSVHCRRIAIHLNWELFKLANEGLRLYSERKLPSYPTGNPTPVTKKPSELHHLHVIMIADTGSISIETINLKTTMVSRSLQASLVSTERENKSDEILASAILHADVATAEISSHGRKLLTTKLWRPNIYFFTDHHEREGIPTAIWNLAGNCEEVFLQVHEDVVGLIEVTDRIIDDEVRQVYQLIQKWPETEPAKREVEHTVIEKVNRLHLAFFLDSYSIGICLVPSLTYQIRGTVARTSLISRLDGEIVIDYDIKENAHVVQTGSDDDQKTISLLQLPPINGRLSSRLGEKENAFKAFFTIENIALDGAALHSLLNVLDRMEVINIVEDAKADVSLVRMHLDEVFGPRGRPISKPSKPTVYEAHITVAGFGVAAEAPKAHLELTVGSFQINATNRLQQGDPLLEFAEINMDLRKIAFELVRTTDDGNQSCGNFEFGAYLSATSKRNHVGDNVRAYHIKSDAFRINLFAETASSIVDVLGHLQGRIRDLDFSREVSYVRKKLRRPKPQIDISGAEDGEPTSPAVSSLFNALFSLEMLNIQIAWIVGESSSLVVGRESEDLVISLKMIELATKKERTCRLMIEDLLMQMVPVSQQKAARTLNSALLPQVIFNVAYLGTKAERRFAFQAKGKALDLRLTPQFIMPASDLQNSIATAAEKLRLASTNWKSIPSESGAERSNLLGNKRLASLLVDADFAGAVVYVQGRKSGEGEMSPLSMLRGGRLPQHGLYGQYSHEESATSTTLRSPGLAFKVEYTDDGKEDPTLKAEIKIDASENILYPTVVPIIVEISNSVKDIMEEANESEATSPAASKTPPQKSHDESVLLQADPAKMLGKTRLNVGIRICRQEFSMSCQPIARVAATTRFKEIYTTINTVQSAENGHFFAVSTVVSGFQTSVQHVYSREPTGSFDVDSVVLSLMNSRHVSGTTGISAILKFSPMKASVNAKQLQDFLLFQEIWIPTDLRGSKPSAAAPQPTAQGQYMVQRYQEVAAAGAFAWNATISITELDLQLDLGQSIGKSAFKITNLWVASKKNSDWEQNLCLGFDEIGISGTGRMSGFVELQDLKVRMSIQWPEREAALNKTPLIQASVGFAQLRVKVAFDYQPFLVADITAFEYLMYNVREHGKDRLVGILNGNEVQIFVTTNSSSQGLALYQAFIRLIQEKKTAYESSLKDIEKFLRRKSAMTTPPIGSSKLIQSEDEEATSKAPMTLHTDVVATVKAVNIGIFPSTFFDKQVLKIEAKDAQARFAVIVEDGKLHSGLGLTLGELRVALSPVRRPNVPRTLAEVDVDDVVLGVTGARGGTILKVPKVIATMQTWQVPGSNHIDYIFKSSFEGKVDVGWNYSRISSIRGMWATHQTALAQRLGKPLPASAVTITGGPMPENPNDEQKGEDERARLQASGQDQGKITAVVNVPQSKYEYTALEPPIIEAPQLRDMGEATPPLEWIGLHRDRLPNLTHQIVIVTLLEVAREVEDAYVFIYDYLPINFY